MTFASVRTNNPVLKPGTEWDYHAEDSWKRRSWRAFHCRNKAMPASPFRSEPRARPRQIERHTTFSC